MNKLVQLMVSEGSGGECASGAGATIHKAVLQSLERVMKLLRPQLAAGDHDDAMIALSLGSAEFEEPLSHFEVTVLACALYMDHQGRKFGYGDVLGLTDRFRGRAMNTTMVYRTIAGLIDRGLVEECGRDINEATERVSRFFSVNEAGKVAFRLAIMNASYLNKSREQKAA